MTGKLVNKPFNPPLGWRIPVALMTFVTTFALDYITKVFVKNTLAITGENISVLPGILSFRFVANTGAAFSMGEGMGWFFAAFAFVVLIAIAVYLVRTPNVSKLETFALGLVAGGALGNALDRVLLGYVVDFIATDFINFPVFNVADIGVSVGVVLAFIGFMFLSPDAKKDATAELNRRDKARDERHAKRHEQKIEKIAQQARKRRDDKEQKTGQEACSMQGRGKTTQPAQPAKTSTHKRKGGC